MSGSTNSIGLSYTTANTADTLVSRDGSGNFSAGTITATLSGTATNATNVATVSAGTNAEFYILWVPSTSNSNQPLRLNGNLHYNPSNATLNLDGGGGGNSNLTIGNGAATLIGTTKALALSSSLGSGNYLNIGANGRNIGIVSGGNHFISSGLDYNITTPGYQYANAGTQAASVLELTTSGTFNFRTAPSGSNGAAATVTTQVSISNTGVVNIAGLAASGLMQTDGSSNVTINNTLSSTVLGNITKVTVTSLTSGSGTYTPPSNCTHIKIKCWGAGGGGGGVAGTAVNAAGAGGGGGGGYSETIIVSPSAGGYSYSVGALGSGGAAGNNNGSAGGATTFGTLTANGGAGGSGSAAGLGPTIGTAATGGSASGGTLNCNGGSSGNGFILSGTISVGGYGGASPGGGGIIRGRSGSQVGLSGNSPGGGGAGATSTTSSSFAGGDGTAGLIIVEEYYNG